MDGGFAAGGDELLIGIPCPFKFLFTEATYNSEGSQLLKTKIFI